MSEPPGQRDAPAQRPLTSVSIRRPAPLRLHWSRSKPNFGDALAPLVVAAVADRPVRWAPIGGADLVAVGSLLGRLRQRWWQRRVHVWGSGYLAAPIALPSARTRHVIHAVRGPRSAAALGLLPAAMVQGDPGLLADRLITDRALIERLISDGLITGPPRPARRCAVLVIPHYRDREHALLPRLAAVPGVEIADVFAPPLDLLAQIRCADCVLSSAMHGLIAADALGVPNAWVTLGDRLRGGHFKFHDYYGALGLTRSPVPLTEALAADPAAALAHRPHPGGSEDDGSGQTGLQHGAMRPAFVQAVPQASPQAIPQAIRPTARQSWAPATVDPVRHALLQAFPHGL